jgi:hypothetical protein
MKDPSGQRSNPSPISQIVCESGLSLPTKSPNVKISHIFSIPVVCLISVPLPVAVVAQGWPNQPLFQDQQSRTRNLEAGLKKSESVLIDSILNEYAEGIVPLWSESGVAVGIDGRFSRPQK